MADSYFIKRGESINGPFTLKKLQKALSDKKLKANDQLSISNQGPWERISSLHKDIKAGKHPFVADEAAVDVESIMDEWMEEQPTPTQPSPELGEPSTHDEAYSLPSKPPEIVTEGDDDEHEVDDQPAPSISPTGDGSAVKAQDEERPPSRKAINPIIAGGILIVALIAIAAVFQGKTADEDFAEITEPNRPQRPKSAYVGHWKRIPNAEDAAVSADADDSTSSSDLSEVLAAGFRKTWISQNTTVKELYIKKGGKGFIETELTPDNKLVDTEWRTLSEDLGNVILHLTAISPTTGEDTRKRDIEFNSDRTQFTIRAHVRFSNKTGWELMNSGTFEYVDDVDF